MNFTIQSILDKSEEFKHNDADYEVKAEYGNNNIVTIRIFKNNIPISYKYTVQFNNNKDSESIIGDQIVFDIMKIAKKVILN